MKIKNITITYLNTSKDNIVRINLSISNQFLFFFHLTKTSLLKFPRRYNYFINIDISIITVTLSHSFISIVCLYFHCKTN